MFRSVPKSEVKVLSLCGQELSLAGFDSLAREAYLKMDDFSNVMMLYVKSQVNICSTNTSTQRRELTVLHVITQVFALPMTLKFKVTLVLVFT